jgi:NAD-dependent dihydropyrimidine dehydrogenase PreA subunit
MRKIVKIDEAKCNGCGACVPKCAEGAIRLVGGKARLAAENLCDGLGACLGECPQGAITIEERPSEEFDRHAVEEHTRRAPGATPARHEGGCSGSRMRLLRKPAAHAQAGAVAGAESQLAHWPVQLALVPEESPIWQGADVLICADCVPFAMPDFHARLLAGRSLAVGCPKLDDVEAHAARLARLFAANDIRSISVAHMEVPCCMGLVFAVRSALERAGRGDMQVHDVTVGIDGTIKKESQMEELSSGRHEVRRGRAMG